MHFTGLRSLPHPNSRLAVSAPRFFLLCLLVTILTSALAFLGWSIHWPLVGDSAQIHYICFLMDRGMAPYRVTGDMNMPGALLLEWAAMHTLGPGSLAWRCFDLLQAGLATAAMAYVCGPRYRLAGLGAGLLFLLIHGADGLNDTGERDLSIAVLLLLAYAALFAFLRQSTKQASFHSARSGPHLLTNPDTLANRFARSGALHSFAFGLSVTSAVTIKPTVLPLTACLVFVWVIALRRRTNLPSRAFSAGVLGLALPFAAVCALLARQRAFPAFLHGLRTAVPFYASLQHQTTVFLLLHSLAPLLPAVCFWLLGPAWLRPLSLERALLLLGAAFGLLSYLAQAKGFPYYRYPLLAFLLPLMAADCVHALRPPRRLPTLLPALALHYGTSLAPLSAAKAHRFRWQDRQFLTSLTRALQTLHARDGETQCIDSISGCGNALLRLRLVQTTGLLSDFFVFGPPQAPAVQEARAAFVAATQTHPPQYLIVTDGLHLHPGDPGHWSKLARWPWFQTWLGSRYTLVLTRYPTRPALWWARPQMPAFYRLYVRNSQATEARSRLAGAAGLSANGTGPLLLPEP